MAKKGFSLATPLGVVVVRPDELWRDARRVAVSATERLAGTTEQVRASATAALDRLGGDLAAGAKLNNQLLQAAAVRAGQSKVTAKPVDPRPPATRRPQGKSTTPDRGPSGRDVLGRLYDVGLQADAAVRGVADTLTFGMADEIAGGMNALLDGSDRSLSERFSEHHQNEITRDIEDLEKRKYARRLGQAAGLALSVGAQTPATAARAVAPKFLNQMSRGRSLGLVPRLQTTAREVGAASAAAGAANGGAQVLTDFGSGRRTSPGDFVGAVVGGMTAAPAAIFHSPSLAGALEGAVTSLSQDLMNGRPISYDAAIRHGAGGAAGGHAADVAATLRTKALGRDAKGDLGETLSILKTWARGEVPVGYGQRRYLSRGYTVADPASTIDSVVESKLGRWVQISDPQLLGSRELPNYRIDWWDPSDLGKIGGFGGASVGAHLLPPPPPAP